MVILGYFLPFYPPKKPWKFWKMKKFAGDIIILHMFTKNHNDMMYGSWDTEWDRQKFFSFWAIVCHFTSPHLMIPNVKILMKKKKMPVNIILLHINEDNMICGSSNIRCDKQEFSTFLTIFLPFQLFDKLENQNFNMEKNTWRYYHSTNINNSINNSQWCMVPQIWSAIDRIFCHFGPFFALLPP